MSTFHSLSITDIKRETSDSVAITFDIPSNLSTDFSFVPGQYITLRTTINNNEVRRAYSICSTPSEKNLSVAVKEVENGTFSVFANEKLQKGDQLDVQTPDGKFVLNTSSTNSKTYGAFAAGSGITPIMSMIKTVLKEEPNSKFVLTYGNKSAEDAIFLAELTALQTSYPDRFFLELFYSRKDAEGATFGRIEKSSVNYITKNKYKSLDFDAFYLCGPEAMIQTVTDTLVENGISKEDILFELFTASAEENNVSEALDGKTQIQILVDDETFDFVMDQKKTILDAALAKDIDAPYSCQGGVCSSCICKITEGTAVMEKNSILTDAELEEGLVLACQAHPTSSTLKVDFDDV